jgi:hypothetical protein
LKKRKTQTDRQTDRRAYPNEPFLQLDRQMFHGGKGDVVLEGKRGQIAEHGRVAVAVVMIVRLDCWIMLLEDDASGRLETFNAVGRHGEGALRAVCTKRE